MKLGLNLGSGRNRIESTPEMVWMNIDADPATKPDIIASVGDCGAWFRQDEPLNGKVDEIIANDILEHIPYRENDQNRWRDVLSAWVSCLRPGGTIRIQVPDPHAIFERFSAGDITEETMNRVIYGERTTPWDRHYQLISSGRLGQAMVDMGLQLVEARTLHVCAIVIGVKPE